MSVLRNAVVKQKGTDLDEEEDLALQTASVSIGVLERVSIVLVGFRMDGQQRGRMKVGGRKNSHAQRSCSTDHRDQTRSKS